MSTLDNLSENQTAISETGAPENTSETSFADILSQFEQEHAGPRRGETLHGTVVAVNDDAVIVDIGRKMEGVIPIQKLRESGRETPILPGEQILVSITGINQDGYYELSLLKVERPKDWSALEAAFAEKRTIAGMVDRDREGRTARGRRRARLHARLAQRRPGTGRSRKADRPGDSVPHHQARHRQRRRRGGPPRGARGRAAQGQAGAVRGTAGRSGPHRDGPQPDGLRRLRRPGRSGRPAARGRHLLDPHRQAGRRPQGRRPRSRSRS